MSFKTGKDCKVSIGATKIIGIGTWKMSGVSTDLLESTEFEDEWKSYEAGLKDGGEITFDGLYDPDDATGQTALISANASGTQMTNLRLYTDATHYWSPETTDPVSYVLITGYSIDADKSGLAKVSFTAKVCGKMTHT